MINEIVIILGRIGIKLIELYVLSMALLIFALGFYKAWEIINSVRFKKFMAELNWRELK